jgi:hypothetical protein
MKDDYSNVKSYRVTSLLNCLEKVMENRVAMILTSHCEWHRMFHWGWYGYRRNHCIVDTIGILMVKTQEAWSSK